ncbi:helix-turn-helix transcriptional regulator [Actinomadura montaniterrae]|uniref:AAA family ATPase n=1 Tax=Actinomadura montaniterrae TaxID=1803903 RepID=A0A6L3VQ78_9ACTN|nr:LuxR family transcriptional regulator [Actinomadura montaniterrae]KAB2378911.1 AAA family ATPase [Actinomadura montaniterrae]
MTLNGDAVRGAAQPPLIGRAREYERLLSRLTALQGAVTRAVLVRGEAGIGKSRLLSAAAHDLAGRGWTVLEVRSDEIGALVPYAELRHAVDEYARRDESTVQAELARRLIAALDVATDHPLAAVHATALRFFAALADRAPTVLVVDDLELVDADTLVLVASVLRQRGRHPLAVAAGMRRPDPSGHAALAALLSRVGGDGLLDQVEIGPLDDDAVRRLAELLLADLKRDGAHDEIVATVLRQSGGNPFFAVQSLLGALETESSGASAPLPAFPVDRGRAFLDRVLRVEPEARRIGRAAALLGVVGIDRVPLAADLADLPAARAAAAFDALVGRGILLVGDDGGFRLCHQLVRDALYREIGPAERARWHRMAAERLSELPGSPGLGLEIAAHLRQVAEFGDERAIAVLARAAELACAAAPRSAVPWFEQVLEITPEGHPRRAAIAARLARALLLAGRPRDAIDAGRRALPALADGDARAQLATLVVGALFLVGAIDEAAALADAELGRPGTGLRLLSKAAHVHMAANRPGDALDDVAGVERELDSAPLTERIHALGNLALMRTLQCNADELRALWGRLSDLAEQAPATSRLAAYAVTSYTQAAFGETRAASDSISRAQRLHAQIGWTLYRDDLAVAQTHNAVNLGDWAAAVDIIDSIAPDLDAAGSFMHRDTLRAIKVDVLANRGEWAAARQAAAHPISQNPHGAAVQTWSHAGLEILVGDLDAARTRLERHLDRPDLPDWLRPRLVSRLAEAEIEAGRPRRAAELLAGLAGRRADLIGHPTYVAVQLAYGAATRDTGVLLAGRAVADEHRLAFLSGRARLLLGTHGDDAESDLTAAARTFKQLGATPWRRRAVAELRRRGFKIPRERGQTGTSLTDTEMQIARLVQLGHSNREIAATVFLSVKTVEGHLSRIYHKTGCANRLALTRALDAGLLPS